ncbi:MAG: hypothetical protein V4735_07910 [Pseudomonadota bacterium]
MRYALALLVTLLIAPTSWAATADVVNQCTELHKIEPNRFLCFEGSSGWVYEKVSIYESDSLKPAPDGLYGTMGSSALLLVSHGKAMPFGSSSYLKEERVVSFFNDQHDAHKAYFCKYPSYITQKDSERSYVVGYKPGSCAPVPDGNYQAKGGLEYSVHSGTLFEKGAPNGMTCFHNWAHGKEVLECEDRN